MYRAEEPLKTFHETFLNSGRTKPLPNLERWQAFSRFRGYSLTEETDNTTGFYLMVLNSIY